MPRILSSRQLLSEGLSRMTDNPALLTQKNMTNLRIAAALLWQQEEMGGIEHVQFALRNSTPVVPPEHPAHPVQLRMRGFIDGKGWPNAAKPRIVVSQWPGGSHFYASVDGNPVSYKGKKKWDTHTEADYAANRFMEGTL